MCKRERGRGREAARESVLVLCVREREGGEEREREREREEGESERERERDESERARARDLFSVVIRMNYIIPFQQLTVFSVCSNMTSYCFYQNRCNSHSHTLPLTLSHTHYCTETC